MVRSAVGAAALRQSRGNERRDAVSRNGQTAATEWLWGCDTTFTANFTPPIEYRHQQWDNATKTVCATIDLVRNLNIQLALQARQMERSAVSILPKRGLPLAP